MSTIYVDYGSDGTRLARSLLEASGVLDGIGRASVAIKPNLVTPSPAQEGATTHPAIAEGVIQSLIERGVRDISIIESSWVGASTREAFKVCGYEAISKKYNVPLYDLKRDATVETTVAGKRVVVSKRAMEADILINLPVLKAHCQTKLTCAIKNLKGCIPDSEKRKYHAEGLMEPIARLGAALRPSFTLVDAICGDLTFEEGGTPVRMDMAFIGDDIVAVDAYAATLLGYAPEDIRYISLCEQFGGGSSRIDKIVGVTQPINADEGKLTRARLSKNICEDGACSACVGALMRALYRLEREGKKITEPVYIGQGYARQDDFTLADKVLGEGIGIGRCCAGMARNVPGCPPTAQMIYEALSNPG